MSGHLRPLDAAVNSQISSRFSSDQVSGGYRGYQAVRKVSGGYMGKTGGYKEFDLVDLVVAMSVCLCVCPLFVY